MLAAGYLGLCAFALHHSTIWQETFVLGVNIGGMTEEEAAQAVSNALPDMQISLYLYPDGGGLPGHRCADSGCADSPFRPGRTD